MSPYTLPDHLLDSLLQEHSLCGSEEARHMGELRGLTAVGRLRENGIRLAAGNEILRQSSNAASLHVVWKTAQTLMEYLSGIASSVADIVATAQRGNPATSVVCTRKNFPGTKAAAMKAVLCGATAIVLKIKAS